MKFYGILTFLLLSLFLTGCKPEVLTAPSANTEVDTDPLNLSPIQLTNSIVVEYSQVGTTVGLLEQAQQEEATYTLIDDNGGMFELVNGNEIRILDRQNLDYEISTVEEIQVQATSATQGSRTDTLQIAVANAETEMVMYNIVVNPDADGDLCNYTGAWVEFDVDVNLEVDKNVGVSRSVVYPLDESTVDYPDFYGTYTTTGLYTVVGDSVHNLPGPATATSEMIVHAISDDGFVYSIRVDCLTETATAF